MVNYTFIVCAFAFSIFFVRFDGYIVNLAMPTFVNYFNVSISRASWISVIYILSQASTILLFGKLCDRLEIKKIFIYGLGIFTLSSLFCGASTHFLMLLASRCLQGVGGSMMLVSSYAAMVSYLPREKVGWGLGIMTVSAALGVLLGPVAGGYIIHYLNWSWIFYINIPLGLFGLIFSQIVIPHIPGKKSFSARDLDIKGVILSAAGLFLFLYSLNMIDEFKLHSPVVWGSMVLSIVFFVVYYLEEKKSASPLVDMKLFKNRDFTLVIFSTIAGFLLFFGGSFLVPFYLTEKGLDPKQIGLVLTIFSLVYMPIGLYSGTLSDRVSPRKIVCLAMILAAITGFTFSGLLGYFGVSAAVVYLVMLAISYGIFFAPINHYIMNFADADNKGSVSALYNTSLNIAMALGVVLLETIYTEFRGLSSAEGFRAAFLTGGTFCLISFITLKFFIRDRK